MSPDTLAQLASESPFRANFIARIRPQPPVCCRRRPSRTTTQSSWHTQCPKMRRFAFYLRYRQHIEEWAALREQAARELEEALVRAVGIMRVPDHTNDHL